MNHLDPNLITFYVAHSASVEERILVEDHCIDCEECRDQLTIAIKAQFGLFSPGEPDQLVGIEAAARARNLTRKDGKLKIVALFCYGVFSLGLGIILGYALSDAYQNGDWTTIVFVIVNLPATFFVYPWFVGLWPVMLISLAGYLVAILARRKQSKRNRKRTMNENSLEQSDPFMTWINETMKAHSDISNMDDRKLLWCLMKSKVWSHPIGSIEDALLQEAAIRLYPEFDGDEVVFEEWGWKTPEGDIHYLEQI